MRTLAATTMALTLLATSGIGAAAQGTDGQTTTDELLAGMVTEEVEPGVVRVVNDGQRDLSRSIDARPAEANFMALSAFDEVITGLDGSLWLDSGDDRYLKVGSENVLELPRGVTRSSDKFTISELLVDREGTPWVAVTEQVRPKGRWAFRSVLYAHDGDDWERRFERSRTGNLGTGLRLGPDGSAWALTATEGPGTYRFFRLDGTRWTRIPRPPAPADSPDHQIRSWGIAADGALWMARKRAISRFDGASWETVGRLPKDAGNTLVFDLEGAVHTLLGSDGERTIRTHRRGDDRERSGVPVAPVPGPGDSWGEIDVLAPDGSLWRSLSTTRSCGFWCAYLTACDGLARFDGAEWHGYLEDRCIHEIDFDVLGNTWVRASEPTAGEQVTLDDGTEVQPLTVDRVNLYLIARDASGSS